MDYLALANAISQRKIKIKDRLTEANYLFADGVRKSSDLIDAFHGETHFGVDPASDQTLNTAWRHIVSEEQTHFIQHNKKQPEALQRLTIEFLFKRLASPGVDGLQGIPLSTEDAIVVPYSSTQLLIAALQSRPRQHLHQVLCPEGFYKGSAKLAVAAGLSIRTFPVNLHRDGVMIPERLDNYLARHHQETALLWLTMPGNPLIGCHSVEQLEAIGKIIVQYNLDVLIDMAFDKLLPQDAYPPLPNIRVPDARGQPLYGRTFAITGNSKGFAAAGPWKLGAGVCGNPQWRRKTLDLVTAITFQRESTHLICAGLSNISEAYLENNRKTLQRIQQNIKQRIQQINQKLGDEILFSYGDPVYTPFHCLGVHASYLHKAGIRDSCQLADFLLAGAGIESVELDLVGIHQPGVRLNVAATRVNGRKSPDHADLLFARLEVLMRDMLHGLSYVDVLERIGVTEYPLPTIHSEQ